MVRLFIENNEIELTDNVQVAITKEFEDLSNPTTIINDWSKTVSIPFSAKNNEIFGHIFNPDRIVTYKTLTNYLNNNTFYKAKKWDGSAYVEDSLVSGNVVCTLPVQYLQVGLINNNSTYVSTKNYRCINDIHTFDFTYNQAEDYLFEFSFRDLTSAAPNNEVYFAQWYISGLTNGNVYTISFKHTKDGSNYIISDYCLSPKQSMIGVNFNPLLKLDFRLEWDNSVIMEGYAKLNQVKQVAGKGTYEITLFGQLGKIFQEMKKITFDTTTEDTDYLINGGDYVSTVINKELINASWISGGQSHAELIKTGETGYNVLDIIGFAPNNSYSEGFNYDTYQTEFNQSSQFTDTLGDEFKQSTGIDAGTVIPKGMLPREIGEYRSYLQLPYIYWNKLFQIFQRKAEEITGYQFELDDSWFNKSNPYWYNLVYMLNSFVYGQEQTETNRYELAFQNNNTRWGSAEYTSTKSASVYVGYHDEGGGIIGHRVYHMEEVIPMYDTNNRTWSPGNYGVQINTSFTLRLRYPQFYKNSYEETKLGPSNGLKLTFVVRDTLTSTDVNIWKVFICASNFNGTIPSDINETINVDSISESQIESGNHYSYITFNVPAHLYIPSNTTSTITIKGAWVNTTVPFVRTDGSTTSGTNPIYLPDIYLNQIASYKDFILTDKKRSGSPFILNDLWNKEFNLFDEVLKYCKSYRIGISVDEFEKKVIFKPFCNYFTTYSVDDWTNKIDKSRDFIIAPVTFENKYVLFNYDDNKTKLGSMYKEKYGVNYGDYRLTTDYNFNSEIKKLFDKIKSPMVNTDNVLSWNNLFYEHTIVYSLPAEISVYNKDKDSKQVNIFGTFYFHNGIADFDTEEALNMRSVVISDDTSLQQSTSTYFYAQDNGPTASVTTYPKLDIVRGDNTCTFNIPKENYTYIKNYSGKSSIYTNLWETYINERYNIQNKKITCYVDLKPSEYNQFEWNKLVKVDKQLCVVNKIYDYDITSNGITKVDLITIQDINGYNDDTFLVSIDNLILHFYPTSYLSGNIMAQPSQLGTFETATDVTFANGTKTYTVNGVTFTISGDTVYYQNTSAYVDKDDIDFDVTLKNEHYTASFNCVRYSTYPYPEIKLYNSDGETERNTIYPGSRNYKLGWYGTETEGSSNKPTVAITIQGTGTAAIDSSTWTEREVVIQEGDDEYFRNEYVVNFNTNMTNYSGSYVNVVMTDKEGWHDTVQYPITIDQETIYTLNSDGTARQSTDTVDYRGISSTRGYKVYSNTPWSATLPSGVNSYGPTTGSSGTTSVTFDWGTYTLGSSKTIIFSNTFGDICELTCTYVHEDTIYTLNSDGTERQSEDSVEYHGTSSTRGYQVYSNSSWTASLPQGVSAYGPTSGDAGYTSVTFNWGGGTPNTSKTITFTNSVGDSCELICIYVTE